MLYPTIVRNWRTGRRQTHDFARLHTRLGYSQAALRTACLGRALGFVCRNARCFRSTRISKLGPRFRSHTQSRTSARSMIRSWTDPRPVRARFPRKWPSGDP